MKSEEDEGFSYKFQDKKEAPILLTDDEEPVIIDTSVTPMVVD